MKRIVLFFVVAQVVGLSVASAYSQRSKFGYRENQNGVDYICWKSTYSNVDYQFALENIDRQEEAHYKECVAKSEGKECSKQRSLISCNADDTDCVYWVKSCHKE